MTGGTGNLDFSKRNDNELVNPGESKWKWKSIEDYAQEVDGLPMRSPCSHNPPSSHKLTNLSAVDMNARDRDITPNCIPYISIYNTVPSTSKPTHMQCKTHPILPPPTNQQYKFPTPQKNIRIKYTSI